MRPWSGWVTCAVTWALELNSQDGDEPEFLDALDRINRAGHTHKLAFLGFAMTPNIHRRRLDQGRRAFIIYSNGYGISKSGNESVGVALRQ